MEQDFKYCSCGCGRELVVKKHHKYYGIPKFIAGHNLKIESSELKIIRTRSTPNRKHTEEWKRKISEGNKGKIITIEQRSKISETLKDKYAKGELSSPTKNKFLKPVIKGRRQDYYRRIAFEYYGTTCLRCPNVADLVHHKDWDEHNDRIDNLEPLCKSCHGKEHKTEENFNSGII